MNAWLEGVTSGIGWFTIIVGVTLATGRLSERARLWHEARTHRCCGHCADEYQEAQERIA